MKISVNNKITTFQEKILINTRSYKSCPINKGTVEEKIENNSRFYIHKLLL